MAGEYDFSKPLNLSGFSSMSGLSGINPISNTSMGMGMDWSAPLTSALTGPTTTEAPAAFNWNQPLDFSGWDSKAMGDLEIPDSAKLKTGAVDDATKDPNRDIGMNLPTLQLGFGALKSLGSLYAAFQSNALAKKQFNFQKDAYNQNLTNSIQSYNTALSDRARSRAVMEGQTDAERDAYVSQNSLKKTA